MTGRVGEDARKVWQRAMEYPWLRRTRGRILIIPEDQAKRIGGLKVGDESVGTAGADGSAVTCLLH